MNRPIRNSYIIAVCSLTISLSCKPRDQQFETEARAAFGIIRLLTYYDIEHQNARPTNLSQLFPVMQQGYPYQWDQEFKVYGEHAGFTNSIYEKYVFFPPGITSSWFQGELILMNARPYPAPRREMQRTMVSKTTNGYFREVLSEGVVQRLFKEAKIQEPRPATMLPPDPAPLDPEHKRSFFSRIRGAVLTFLELQGLSGSAAWTVWWILLSLPIVALVSISLWMWRQNRE